jgi:hypothetical protein
MNVVIIIAVISIVWVFVWKFTVLVTMPENLVYTNPVKGIIAFLVGGPIIWIIALMLAFVYGLKIISIKIWEQE